MTILDQILETKKGEVAQGRKQTSMEEMLDMAAEAAPPRPFLNALEKNADNTGLALIAEIKKASPSKGLIREDFDPPTLASAYQDGGATCLSVLTDQQYFMGNNTYLGAARAACTLPVLRKDFMIDPWQIAQSRALGADCVLLIMAALDDETAHRLYDLARHLKMDVLVEVHNAHEMQRACGLGARLIGINNRNLKTFETDLGTTAHLAAAAPKNALLVSESGIHTAKDAHDVRSKGARAILVGESLMRKNDVAAASRALLA